MIIFPEGKTGKYCRIVIKLFLFIYIFNSLVLKAAISLDDFFDFDFSNTENQVSNENYQREIKLSESEESFIALINENLYEGEGVIKDIILIFAEEMKLTVKVYINKSLDIDEQDDLKASISDIFNVNRENVEITF
jgi:hypothetical protein